MNLSEALSVFEDQLPDIRKTCVENIQAIQRTYAPSKEIDIDGDWSKDDIHAHANFLIVREKTEHYLRTINRIDSRKIHHTKNRITEDDIARAKDVQIVDLHDGQLYGSKRKYGNCPFHDEKTPSFYIFPNNKFKCFGCQAYGTSIDYVMKRDGVEFIPAVKTLLGLSTH